MARLGTRRNLLFGASLLVIAASATTASAQGSWVAPADAKNLKNPVLATRVSAKSVEANCASCHGTSGKGDGPAANALPAKPADWTSENVQKQTDGELFWKISNGRGPMPPWKHLPETERWEIVNFIRTLRK